MSYNNSLENRLAIGTSLFVFSLLGFQMEFLTLTAYISCICRNILIII